MSVFVVASRRTDGIIPRPVGRLAQLARASARQAEGHRFDSCNAHHLNLPAPKDLGSSSSQANAVFSKICCTLYSREPHVSRSKPRFPAPVHHKASDQDLLFLRDEAANRRTIYLGKHGSTEAARRYREAFAAHRTGLPLPTSQAEVTASPPGPPARTNPLLGNPHPTSRREVKSAPRTAGGITTLLTRERASPRSCSNTRNESSHST